LERCFRLDWFWLNSLHAGLATALHLLQKRVAQERVTFCANFSRLSVSASPVNLFLRFVQTLFSVPTDHENRDKHNSFAQRKNSKYRNDCKTVAEHLAPELLNQLQWLGFGFTAGP
jgi:hypothetical protein